MGLSPELLEAVDRAIAGDWAVAHAVVQRHQGDRMADWLHAVLHRIEGDDGNARHWYTRAGRSPGKYADPHAELAAIRDAITFS